HNFSVTGTLAKLTVHDFADGHSLSIGGAGAATSFTANNIANLSVTSASAFKSITFSQWLDAGGMPDVIHALSIGKLQSAGESDVGLQLSGGGKGQTLGSAKIKGAMGGVWSVAGDSG